MKECPVCNTQNIDEANVCMECGTHFEKNYQNSNISQQQVKSQEYVNYFGAEQNQNTHYFDNNPVQQNPNIQQYNNSNQYQQPNYQQFNNQNQFQQQNYIPQNKKSKAVGLILNILLVGLGYAYVGKWGEGIVLAVIYIILIALSALIIPLFLAIILWIYSLFKTNSMIDKYNQGLPY